eukprot:9530-Eustigmatos_ZCMA.PRE.1
MPAPDAGGHPLLVTAHREKGANVSEYSDARRIIPAKHTHAHASHTRKYDVHTEAHSSGHTQ